MLLIKKQTDYNIKNSVTQFKLCTNKNYSKASVKIKLRLCKNNLQILQVNFITIKGIL